MITSSTIKFLKDLSKNNNKEWFDANRSRYDHAKLNIEELAAALIKNFGKSDPTVAHLQPRDCMFRINRDIRFSKNKAPYKNNMAVYLSKGGKKSPFAGYYFHFQPGASFVAGGIWQPPPDDMKKIRQEIDYNWGSFTKILKEKSFRSVYKDLDRSEDAVLSRPPKGYEADNPAIEYLKFKSWIATTKISDNDLQSNELTKTLSKRFATLKPLIGFFNHALED